MYTRLLGVATLIVRVSTFLQCIALAMHFIFYKRGGKMSVSILEEIYESSLNTAAANMEKDENYIKFLNIISENIEKLNRYFDSTEAKEEKHLFSQLINAQSLIAESGKREQFISGFRAGARIIFDTFTSQDGGGIENLSESNYSM